MKYIVPEMPTDYASELSFIEKIEERFRGKVGVIYLGRSISGRSIPMLTFGDGAGECVYVGAHHASEHITSTLLLCFVMDALSSGESFPCRMTVIPCLNPDGVELQIHGAADGDPLKERQLKMNGGDDFTHWQANARGVDLNHNYNAGFNEYKKVERELGIYGGAPTRYAGPYPESEPESGRLANYISFNDVRGILTLHTQGEVIYYGKKMTKIAKEAARLTGYALESASGAPSYGGLTDWATESLGIPSLTVECGLGENPLPPGDFPAIYERIRPLLFRFPALLTARA